MSQSLRVSCPGSSNCDRDKEEKMENDSWYKMFQNWKGTQSEAQTKSVNQSLYTSFAIKVKVEYLGVDK